MREKIIWAVVVVALFGVIAIRWVDCHDSGGVFVRGAVGFECVGR